MDKQQVLGAVLAALVAGLTWIVTSTIDDRAVASKQGQQLQDGSHEIDQLVQSNRRELDVINGRLMLLEERCKR